MPILTSMKEAEDFIYQSYLRAHPNILKKKDADVRRPDLTRRLLDLLDSPDADQKFVLVTGSKGKGSTSMFLASLLQQHGYKVGLFTSPHLVQFNERIRLNGNPISTDDFIRLSNRVFPHFQSIEKTLSPTEYQGPIGLALAIAVLYFRENATDISIIECGRGGKYDDTNVLKNDWAVITSIMEEHILQLGPSVYDITRHKLGIVKEGTQSIIIGKQEPYIREYMFQKLQHFSGDKYLYGENFSANHIQLERTGTSFSVQSDEGHYHNMTLPLLGTFQAFNAATAIKTCEAILQKPLNQMAIINSFQSLEWPGRCEVVSQNPTVILDGAINKQSALYVKEVIQSFGNQRVISIVGVPRDKDYKGVIDTVATFSNQLILTKPDISHLIFPRDAYSYAKSVHANVKQIEWLAEAFGQLKNETFDILLIIGTQTLIGNAKRIYAKLKPS